VNDRPSHQRGRLDFVGAVTRTAHHNILGWEELTGYPPFLIRPNFRSKNLAIDPIGSVPIK
jgi:hypothetical protein